MHKEWFGELGFKECSSLVGCEWLDGSKVVGTGLLMVDVGIDGLVDLLQFVDLLGLLRAQLPDVLQVLLQSQLVAFECLLNHRHTVLDRILLRNQVNDFLA